METTDRARALIQQVSRRGFCAERYGSSVRVYVRGRWHLIGTADDVATIIARATR